MYWTLLNLASSFLHQKNERKFFLRRIACSYVTRACWWHGAARATGSEPAPPHQHGRCTGAFTRRALNPLWWTWSCMYRCRRSPWAPSLCDGTLASSKETFSMRWQTLFCCYSFQRLVSTISYSLGWLCVRRKKKKAPWWTLVTLAISKASPIFLFIFFFYLLFMSCVRYGVLI